MYDIEMLQELGFCSGIENYSRFLSDRQPGEPPPTLYDYLAEDTLVFVDESHASLPQLGGMYRGDRSRKKTLVDNNLINQPLKGIIITSVRDILNKSPCLFLLISIHL